ncbi:hypothetical protein QR77_00165 [Streptomyces sp. 150FB]|uniref:hypothetical protein n=1 Tax=Streptomyces sp. 150FB TaxID=1576605 RepID=UPI00058955AD|nr:hypothetical protein QR77_00165 [Streptomyces sp. 150FB]
MNMAFPGHYEVDGLGSVTGAAGLFGFEQGWSMAVDNPFTVRWDAAQRGTPEQLAYSRTAAYDDEACPSARTCEGTPLRAS